MILNRQKSCASVGNMTVGLLAAALLAVPSLGYSGPGAISFEDCEINGFGLGGTADQMRKAFGEPDPISIAKSPKNEYPHREYQYDGLKFVFSTHGRSAMHYIVTSSKFRLLERKITANPMVNKAKIDEAKNVSSKIWAVMAPICAPISKAE